MIKVEHLQYQYPGNAENTIKDISFTIEKGEVFGFLGPSGAGKSTIQKILIGILKNYIGHVEVIDQELSQAQASYFEKIGVAFEFPNFYQRFTAIENLTFFSSLYSTQVEDSMTLLTRVGLEKDANTKVGNFSKGMKMRLNLCRALLHDPDVLFLDEPTSGLDPTNMKLVKDIILEKKKQGKTIVITTHNMTIAEQICDRVAFIVDGKISLIDSPRALKINRGKKVVKVEYKDQFGHTEKKDFRLHQIGLNSEFLTLLKESEIETIHTQETTLEDIFIDVTGRHLV
ncbi:ABC transporter ATP-binding protein [Bacillus alkalicellulosilyticus]|uniref:ABC transporter ATP-binding protein n=1 Tax=Alkalihalobacterium alkalicellulosilyticum TaxID=1912214 RepID=UPI0009986FFE|nr:ABC transporter ATP-binding protein [Bacillus alkalicellulosilyticus]